MPELSHLFAFSSRQERVALFHTIGVLFGLAIAGKLTVPVPLSIPTLKIMLGESVNLGDLELAEPTFHASLTHLLANPGAEAAMLTFSYDVDTVDAGVVTCPLDLVRLFCVVKRIIHLGGFVGQRFNNRYR